MTDVYNRTTFERNSIQEVPEGYAKKSADNLFAFLGSFWKSIHTERPFIRGMQDVRGIKLAQRYLDLLESLRLQDRNGLPVFHRELWKPLVIRLSQRNKARENEVRVGQDIRIKSEGRQTDGRYEGSQLLLGKLADFSQYVTYPVDGEIVDIVSGIANSVINPTVTYAISDDPEGVRYINGTLVFPKDKDPFLENSGFDAYDIAGEDGNPDQELVIWASDALLDRNYVANHMSYAIGATCPSTELAKRILNGIWDSMNQGLTPELVRTVIAAMLDIPVILEDEETIASVVETEFGKTVRTDRHTYTVSPKARLRYCVKTGAKLSRGDLLDESVKIYPLLTDPSPEKLANITEYSDILTEDIRGISLPKSILSTPTAHGLSVDWAPTDVLTAGKDRNGHQKLFFELGGPEDDVDRFWEDVWKRAEDMDIDLADCFVDYEDSSDSSDSDASWTVRPADFFLRYMIGANTLIVTLDHSQIEDPGTIRNPMYFDMLTSVVPSGMRLFFVEHLDGADEEYDMGPETADSADYYASVDAEDEFDYSDLPGMKGKSIPSYEDEVEMKFLRNRRRNAD